MNCGPTSTQESFRNTTSPAPRRPQLLRWELLCNAACGGRILLAGYVLLVAVAAVAPLAAAAAVGGLLGAVAEAADSGARVQRVIGPVLLVAGSLVVLQMAALASSPLARLLEARVDGAMRQEVLVAVAVLPTVDRIADPALRDDLARFTTGGIAWMQGGIGAGALAQVRQLIAYAALLPGAAVLSARTWWWGPAVAGACLLLREIDARGFLQFEGVLDAHKADIRRTQQWRELIAGREHAREVRLLGLADWLMVRHDATLHRFSASLDSARVSLRRRQLVLLGAVVSFCAAVYLAMGAAGAGGAVPLADLATVLGIAGAMLVSGDTQAAMLVETALPMASAVSRLRASSVQPPSSPSRLGERRDLDTPPFIRLRGVSLTHPGAAEPVVRQLDLDLRPGEVLALVGANGAGKSTVAHLFAGFYHPSEGEITINGIPMDAAMRASWAHTVHTVSQDIARFQLSVFDAVRIVAPEATDAEVAEAASHTGLDRHVARFPLAWQTPLGESQPHGVTLSGGQWQCLALTRALLAARRGARVLILDEPTSNLDIEAELALSNTVLACRGKTSILLVSHRLATVRSADRIAVLHCGAVIECGTHTELMAANGKYARMYRVQALPYLGHQAQDPNDVVV